MSRRLSTAAALAALALGLPLGGCDDPGDAAAGTDGASASAAGSTTTARATGAGQATAPTATTAPSPARPARRGTALALLEGLAVKGRAPRTGYAREAFGAPWVDVDGNGCDTRADILRRDLRARRVVRGSGGCALSRGVLVDRYTGRRILYRPGVDTIDVDHVVALGDAWQKGAQRFPFAKRVALANDPLNLLAVGADANRAKGGGDAATWLPPRRTYRCAYAARQIAVKAKYGLWVTAAERDALRRILADCPRLRPPPPGPQPVLAADTGGPEPGTGLALAGGTGAAIPYFPRCADARAVGAAPLRRGTPAYDANRHLDRDGDGVACEA